MRNHEPFRIRRRGVLGINGGGIRQRPSETVFSAFGNLYPDDIRKESASEISNFDAESVVVRYQSSDPKADPIPKEINETSVTARIQFLHLIHGGHVVEQFGNIVVGNAEGTDRDFFIASDDDWRAFRQNTQFARTLAQKMFQQIVNGIQPGHAIPRAAVLQPLPDRWLCPLRLRSQFVHPGQADFRA